MYNETYWTLCDIGGDCYLLCSEFRAQHIVVSAPSHVSAGENFRPAYTINTRDVEEFRMGGVPKGLEVIAGPYTSQQSSYQMINGHTSSSSSVTITYTLYAAKNGSYTIGSSHAVVNGKRIASRAVKVSVYGHAEIPMVLRICTEVPIWMMNLVCDRLVLLFTVEIFSSRFLPIRKRYMNRNLSC